MAVYMIRFDKLIGGRARYYIGFSSSLASLERRLKHHASGAGACITRYAAKEGIGMSCVAIMPDGTREDERELKRIKSGERALRRLTRGGFAVDRKM